MSELQPDNTDAAGARAGAHPQRVRSYMVQKYLHSVSDIGHGKKSRFVNNKNS